MARPRRARVLALALLMSAGVAHAGNVQQQAEQLAQLRAEVEGLSEQLQADKDDSRGRLRAIEAQKVELEVQIRRQELRLERLLDEERRQRELLAEAEGGGSDLGGTVTGAIAALRGEVAAGLPFKQDQRLAAIDELQGKLDDETMTAEQVAARVWAFAEDERRLTRENTLDRQVIQYGGEEVLVDIVRIGMVALYWRAPDGTVGRAARQGGAWTYTPMTGAEGEAVLDLFDTMGKGIRTGWFSLPGLAAEVTR